MRITIKNLKSLIREALDTDKEVEHASLDSQVEKYLGEYESQANTAKKEGISRRHLIEADEEATTTPSKLTLDDLNVEKFADSVAQMIENYDSLLEVRNTLVRMAHNFLAEKYDEDVVKDFDAVMRDEHSIVPGETKHETEEEMFEPPPGDHAGIDVGGGAAGGG